MPHTFVVLRDSRVIALGYTGQVYKQGVGCSELWETSPALGTRDDIRLTYSGDTLILRNPSWNNEHSVDLALLRHENRSGVIIVANKSYWGQPATLNFKIEKLSLAQKETAEDWFRSSAGYQITLLDYENRTWVGVITTPVIDMIHEGRGCQYLLNFQFEGALT